MKYLVVGDPHAKPSNLDKIEKLVNMVEEQQLPTIWLGDQLDTKEIINGKCLNLWHEYYSNSDLDHIILVGNHDRFNKYSEEHSLQVISTLPNVTVVQSPITLDGIDFIPYCDNESIYRHIEQSDAKLGFAHIDIQGFDYGNGVISKEGLSKDTFTKYSKLIIGHYHKHQQKDNIMYLGTPFSHSFGESNQSKYIMTIDTDTLEYELIETDFPKHVTLEYNCDTNNSVELCIQDKLNDLDYIRAILRGNQENIDKVNKKNYPTVKFIEKPTIETKGLAIDETLDHTAQFKKWAETRNLKETTIEKGLEFLNNVS